METATISPASTRRLNEVSFKEPPTVTDPWSLMDKFYKSNLYQEKLKSFFENKTLATDVTEKEKERVFLESANAEYALIRFGSENVDFRFKSERYPQKFLSALSEYRKTVKSVSRMGREIRTNEEVLALDTQRFQIHTEAARALVDAGIAPSVNIGRAITSLILVNEGLESKEDAQKTTASKIRNKLAG
jgi:hypothetical protein